MGRTARRTAIYGLGFLVGYVDCWVILLLAAVSSMGRGATSGMMILVPAAIAGTLAYWAPRHGVHWGVAVSIPMLFTWAPPIIANASDNLWRAFPLLISLGLSALTALFISMKKQGAFHPLRALHASTFTYKVSTR